MPLTPADVAPIESDIESDTEPTGQRVGIVGLHHLRLPVRDVLAARAWLIEEFGFDPVLIEETEDKVTGAVVEHPTGLVIGLHADPARCAALGDFIVIALAVDDLEEWDEWLTRRSTPHEPITSGSLGQRISVPGAGGVIVELHSPDHPDDGAA